MLSPQLIKILRTLDSTETEAFSDFIYSPYFNKSKTIQKFWEAIKKYSPSYDAVGLKKETLYKEVYDGKEYKYATMKNLIFTFTGLLETFMELRSHERNKFQMEYNTLVYSTVRYLPELFKKKFKEMMKDYERIDEGLDLHYMYKYLLIRVFSSFSALESRRVKDLFEQGDSLIYFFLIHLFQVHYNIKVFYDAENYAQKNNLVEKLLNIMDLERIMLEIKTNSPKDFQIVDLYYHLYLCQSEPENDKYYFEYKKNLLSARKILHPLDFKSLTNGMIHILNERAYRGIHGTQKETGELFKLLIDLDVGFTNTENNISFLKFSLSIKNFLEAVDIIYAGQFYEKFKNRLIEKDKENMHNFYNAYLNYAKGNFDRSLEFSSKIKLEVDNFKLSVKGLQLKCYFELNETEAFYYSLDAFKHLVSRNDFINKERKQYTKNFLKAIAQLFEYKTSGKGTIDNVNILMQDKMLNKEWMLEKINELKKN